MAPRARWLIAALPFLACDHGAIVLQPPDASMSDAISGPDGADAVPLDGSDGTELAPFPTKVFELLDDLEARDPGPVTPIGLASWTAVSATSSSAARGVSAIEAPDVPRSGSLSAQHARVAASETVDLRIDFHGPEFFTGGFPFPDVSGYAGVAFWSRAPTGTTSVVAALEDDQVYSAKSYAETRASEKPWFEAPVAVSPEWRRHILLFDDFRQPEHPEGRFNAGGLWRIHFVGGLEGAGAEFWIDDLALLCRGACPKPLWDLHPTPGPGMDDHTLPWVAGQTGSDETMCAVVAPLSLAPLSEVPADPVEKLILRVRIPIDPAPAVPAWAWLVEDLASGAKVGVTPIDEAATTVAVPITAAGHYRVIAHTHFPGITVCGVATEIDAH